MKIGKLNLFGRREAVRVERKASAAGRVLAAHKVGRPIWTPRDYAKLIHESYLINPVSFRCTKLIATCAAQPGFLLFKNGDRIYEHPLLDLLNRPSPSHGGRFFQEMLYSFLLLAGNTYVEKVGPNDQNKPPRELWVLRPDRMKVIPGKYGVAETYRYEQGGNHKDWTVNPITGQSDVLHIKEFHPLDDWYGMSRVEAAAFGVDRNNAAAAHNKALLDNGARPSGALVFEPMKTDEGEVMAPESAITAAMDLLESRHGGPNNAGNPMVFGGKVHWEEMGLSPKDMDFDEGKQDSARDICNAWGVPHVLLVRGDATYNNVREAKLELYEDTVLPLMDHVVSEFNNWLTPLFGDGLELVSDLDAISALEPRREAKRTSVTNLLDKGVIDADEAREDLDYGERREEAVRKVDASVLTALLKVSETVGMMPLHRYMVSVGLIEANTKEQDLIDAALALIEGDEEDETDDEEGQAPDGNPGEGDDPNDLS